MGTTCPAAERTGIILQSVDNWSFLNFPKIDNMEGAEQIFQAQNLQLRPLFLEVSFIGPSH